MRAGTEARRMVTPRHAAELFVLGNLAFLAVDIYLAHSYNDFAHPAEWVPVYFSAVSPLWLGLAWGLTRRGAGRASRALGIALGVTSVAVGVAGFALHLESSFFVERTLKSIVYAAPFAGPLAYGGLGLLLILSRMVGEDEGWGRWVILLALGGFLGNLALALADHAQGGFFDWRAWIAVASAAFATTFLGMVWLRPRDGLLRRATGWVMVLQIFVGLLGFGLHLAADARGPMETFWENVIYLAPPFAPLLFPNIALLALIGLWSLGRRARLHAGEPEHPR